MASQIYTGIPDLDAEELSALRKQKVAEMLMGQSLQGVQPYQQAGAYVAPMHWSQGLAQVAQALLAAKKGKAAEAQLTGIAGKRKAVADAAMQRFQAKSAGGDAGIRIDRLDGGSDVSGLQYKADPEGAAIELAGNPAVPAATREAGLLQYQAGVRRDEKEAAAAEARLARKEQIEARAQELEMRLADRNLDRQSREQIAQMLADSRADLARLTASMRNPIQVTDEAGNTTLYDQQGNLVKDLGNVGKPSATYEKKVNARQQLERDMDRVIPELEAASADGGLIDQSTGSGAGALVDSAAGFFGVATPGAVAVGKMKPIYDLALKMVPRFEGPQSDKDTTSYQDAAGQLANPAVPNEQKKAAAREIVRLMKARRGQFISADDQGGEIDSPASGNDALFNQADAILGGG